MSTKDIKAEARQKLAINMHQSVAVYAIEFIVFMSLAALIVMSCVALNSILVASIVMICYGCVLFLGAIVGSGIIGFGMIDHYLATFRCKPYNFRRIGETLSHGGVGKILVLNIIRVCLGFLLLLCLIVPGVIYLIRTSMANYLLIANPKMKAKTALNASNKVMSGKTGAYFALMMSFTGWFVLGIFTLGLGFIFIMPYINLTKTVYYKRNLQGDINIYKPVPQPVSPMPEQPMPQNAQRNVQAQNMQNAQQNVDQPILHSEPDVTVRPINIDTPIPPIATLAKEDAKDMADAILDFGGEVPEVPEVPIMPVTTSKKSGKTKTAMGDSHPVAGSDFVETVKPLTTNDLDALDSVSKKYEQIYKGNSTHTPSDRKRDYFGSATDSPNDFVTAEMPVHGLEEEINVLSADPAADIKAETPVVDVPLDGIKGNDSFDMFEAEVIPEVEPVFTPSEPSVEIKNEPAHASFTPPVHEERRTATTAARPAPHAHDANPASAPQNEQPSAGTNMDRVERARLEREERLKNLLRK